MLSATGGPATPRPLLVYDGDCAMCRRWVERLRALDHEGCVDTMPLRHAAAPLRTGRSRIALAKAVHVVRADGAVVDGATAVREVLRYLRGGRLVRGALGVPGAMWVADRIYAWVAGRRASVARREPGSSPAE